MTKSSVHQVTMSNCQINMMHYWETS